MSRDCPDAGSSGGGSGSMNLHCYFAPGSGAKYCDECVCLSVPSHISKTMWLIFTKFFLHVACGCGLVLLWQHCDIFVYFWYCG